MSLSLLGCRGQAQGIPIEMHQVRYFLSLAEELNFSRAATKCNVSQPAFSRAIKALKEEFGGLLFHREGRFTHLSELGQMVKPHLDHVFRESNEAKQRAKDFAGLRKLVLKPRVAKTIARIKRTLPRRASCSSTRLISRSSPPMPASPCAHRPPFWRSQGD